MEDYLLKERKSLMIVDMQEHFMSSGDGSFNYTADFDRIIKNIKENHRDFKEIILVVDKLFLQLQEEDEDYECFRMVQESVELEEYVLKKMEESYNKDDYDEEEWLSEMLLEEKELFVDKYHQYFSNKVPLKLIIALIEIEEESKVNIKGVIEKEYGLLRDLMSSRTDIFHYFLEIKKVYDKKNQNLEDIEEIRVLIEEIIEVSELTIEGIEELLNDANFEVDELSYYYKENNIRKREPIVLCGGGACECLLEEFLKLDANGYNVEIDSSKVYGDVFEMKSKLSEYESQKDFIKKNKFKPKENTFRKIR